MSISLQLLWVLSGLGAAVFAASGRSNLRLLIGIAVGFIASVWFVPDTSWVGGTIAVIAAAKIFRPKRIPADVPALTSGCLAGCLAVLMTAEGMPNWAALAIAAALPVATALLTRNPTFAPPVLQEEGLLLMLLLGVASSVIPSLLEGWQAAGALNARAASPVYSMPVWVMAASAGAMVCGAMWSVWRHR